MFLGIHTNAIRISLSGQVRVFRVARGIFSRFFFPHGRDENITGKTLLALAGLRTASQKQGATSKGSPSGSLVRRDSLGTVSGARDRLFLVIPGTFYFLPSFIMDDKKKKVSAQAEQAADPQAANGPIKVFVVDDVSASVFSRVFPVKGQNRTFYSVSFSRSYRDPQGSRKYVKTFNLEDLGKVVTVAQQSEEHIHKLQHPEVA